MKIEQNWWTKIYKPKIHNGEYMICTNRVRDFELFGSPCASIQLDLNCIDEVERERERERA